MEAQATDRTPPGMSGRRGLCLVFASGFATLLVEIIGAKLLGPFFGNSHFVWTNQMLVTLLALAAGAWLGGRLADRGDGRPWLALMFLVAAGWMCLLFPVLEKANYFFLRFHVGPGAIMASGFLCFVPLAALGTAPPLAVVALIGGRDGAGCVAGRVFGVATLGGVAGCVVAGGWLIPSFPNEVSLLMAALGTLGVGGFAAWHSLDRGRARGAVAVSVGLLAAIGVAGCLTQLKPRRGLGAEIARHASGHSLLLVMEDPESGRRYLVDDFVLQNCFDPGTGKSCAAFTHALRALTLAYAGVPARALCVGLGIGVDPMELAAAGSEVEAVEIHPGIATLAEERFGFDPEVVKVHLGDGRGFLHGRREEYDVVILDAFSGDSSPSHLLTREALTDARSALKPDGVLILNCIASMEPGRDLFVRSVKTTMETVFRECVLHVSPGGNLFFVAGEGGLGPDFERGLTGVDSAFLERVEKTLADRRAELGGGVVMTDDFNPIEFHDAAYRADAREKLAWLMYRD